MESSKICEVCKVSKNLEIGRIIEKGKPILCINCFEKEGQKSQISKHLSPEMIETNEKRKNYGGSKSNQDIRNNVSFDLLQNSSKISINSQKTEISEKTKRSEEEKLLLNKKKKKYISVSYKMLKLNGNHAVKLNDLKYRFNQSSEGGALFEKNSYIYQTAPNKHFIHEIFYPKKIKSIELLFRASEYNFSSKKFHEFCDKKFPTLILIRTKKNKYFGGFTTAAWLSRSDDLSYKKWKYFSAPSSFLFSLDNKTKHELINSVDSEAICCDISYGPTFGYDLIICDECNTMARSIFHLGWNYKLNENKDSETTLAEEKYFLVEEYEVFVVKFHQTIMVVE